MHTHKHTHIQYVEQHTWSYCCCIPLKVSHWVIMIWWRASITDDMLFYLHNTSPLGRWCGLCKTTLDLWGHFHACYHRKYECPSACVREGRSESPSSEQQWQHTHSETQRLLCFDFRWEWICVCGLGVLYAHIKTERSRVMVFVHSHDNIKRSAESRYSIQWHKSNQTFHTVCCQLTIIQGD